MTPSAEPNPLCKGWYYVVKGITAVSVHCVTSQRDRFQTIVFKHKQFPFISFKTYFFTPHGKQAFCKTLWKLASNTGQWWHLLRTWNPYSNCPRTQYSQKLFIQQKHSPKTDRLRPKHIIRVVSLLKADVIHSTIDKAGRQHLFAMTINKSLLIVHSVSGGHCDTDETFAITT